MLTDTYQTLIAIALDQYAEQHSGGATEWEYVSNKNTRNASRDFILFLNKMVIDRLEKIEADYEDDEPEHAPSFL